MSTHSHVIRTPQRTNCLRNELEYSFQTSRCSLKIRIPKCAASVNNDVIIIIIFCVFYRTSLHNLLMVFQTNDSRVPNANLILYVCWTWWIILNIRINLSQIQLGSEKTILKKLEHLIHMCMASQKLLDSCWCIISLYICMSMKKEPIYEEIR